MKVVITGGHGFLGSYVVKQCIDFGMSPIVLQRKDSSNYRLSDQGHVDKVPYENLLDENVLESLRAFNPECFIHIAWKGVDSNTRNNHDQLTYNLSYTLDTVKAAHSIGCKHWIGIGSLTEYDLSAGKVDEQKPTIPHTTYGKSKLAACWASSAYCDALTIDWSWIRVGSIYGPGDNDNWLIPYVVNSLLKEAAPKLTACEQFWDYLYVTDAANAILAIAKENAKGIFNLGSGQSRKIYKIIDIIVDQLNTSIKPDLGSKPYAANQIMHMEADIKK